ncbi:MAG TPA: hypothetical protein PLO93_01875 [Candidatus Omnitrophota bacterium]|nr:hypothetical protein [Candidatus Omnitrophota bacterium]HQL41028.1 hypothetical protein [Candidatus Omnitrophota bacterium]
MPCLGTKEIEAILPQKYPFLLIDRVLDYKEDDYLVAIKNITGNEWSSVDSVSQLECWPEMLAVEGALQAAIILYHKSKNFPGETPVYFIGKVISEFYCLPKIGDSLNIVVSAEKLMRIGGYARIDLKNQKERISSIEIFFSVKR